MAAILPTVIVRIDIELIIPNQLTERRLLSEKNSEETLNRIVIPAIFGTIEKNVVTGIGEPSYTSGVHI
jgi:hypothetical protein